MSSNAAAWQTAEKAHPFSIQSADTWTPSSSELLLRNRALAINPIDAALQYQARFPLQYPTIFGSDVAGEVLSVGADVTRFKPGDRVVGHAVGLATKRHAENGFQLYTILNAHMASEVPDSMPFEEAAVVPLGLSTAACGLFQKRADGFLGLRLPTSPKSRATGEALLVWGGASSVGSNAIQMAVAAGYEVVSTASGKNFEYVKGLGAKEVFDYGSKDVVEEIVKALGGKTVVGALDCIGGAACVSCVEVVHRTAGEGIVATTKGGCDEPPQGVSVKRIFGTTLKDNGVGQAVYQDFLPEAFKSGEFVPSPKPQVVGTGLESLQKAVDMMMKGVSATKLVVTLE